MKTQFKCENRKTEPKIGQIHKIVYPNATVLLGLCSWVLVSQKNGSKVLLVDVNDSEVFTDVAKELTGR